MNPVTDKEVKSFRLRLVNILKPYLEGLCTLSVAEGYGVDVVEIERKVHRQRLSVFVLFLKVRELLSVDASELVKYISASTPSIERAIAKQILTEGTKKLRRLVPVYTHTLIWYQDKMEKREKDLSESIERVREKEEAQELVRLASIVRRIVVEKYLSKGLPIPAQWINDDMYNHKRLIENYKRDGNNIEQYYPD